MLIASIGLKNKNWPTKDFTNVSFFIIQIIVHAFREPKLLVGVRWWVKPSSSPKVKIVVKHTWLNLTRTLVKGTCKLFSFVAFKCYIFVVSCSNAHCHYLCALLFGKFCVFWLIVVRNSNLGSRNGALGLALDINMVFEMAHDSKPKKCFHA